MAEPLGAFQGELPVRAYLRQPFLLVAVFPAQHGRADRAEHVCQGAELVSHGRDRRSTPRGTRTLSRCLALEEEFPNCKTGYSDRPGHVTWSAQLGPMPNEDSPDALRGSIRRGYAEMVKKLGERTRDASPAAAEPAYDPVAEP